MRRYMIVGAAVMALSGATASGATADQNPAGTGQPGTAQATGAACGDANSGYEPPGFASGGFANAATHYAGSPGTPSAANGAANAISEYDIACYQQTQNHTADWLATHRPPAG